MRNDNPSLHLTPTNSNTNMSNKLIKIKLKHKKTNNSCKTMNKKQSNYV